MRVPLILAATLSLGTVLASPYAVPKPFQGRELLARMPPGRESKYQYQGGGRKLPGYSDKGIKHPDADGYDRQKVQDMVRQGERRVPDTPYRANVIDHEPKGGESAEMKETFSDRPPRYTGYLGNDFSDHQDGLRFREAAYPEVRDAEYRPSSEKGRRRRVIGGLPANKDLKGDGPDPESVHEEKGLNAFGLKPVNHMKRIPPATTIQASTKASRKRDGPMARSLWDKAYDDGGTVRLRANPNSKDAPMGPVLPLRSKKVEGFPTPVDEQFDDLDTYFEASDRSRSPKSDGSQDYKLRDRRRRGHRSKRDMVGSASSQESNKEASNPDTNNDFKQEYEQYLQGYGVVQSNATDIIMPLVEEMVDGHNSTLVWGAAWEILTLANPNFIVMGPFLYGMHAFDYYEDAIKDSTDNETMAAIIAIDDFLIELYQTTWNKAYDALNSSGLLHDLDILARCLTSNDTSVADLNEDPTTTDSINEFFLDYLNSSLVEHPSDDSVWRVVDDSTSGDKSTFSNNSASGDNGITWSQSSAYLAMPRIPIQSSKAASDQSVVSIATSGAFVAAGTGIGATSVAIATNSDGSPTPTVT